MCRYTHSKKCFIIQEVYDQHPHRTRQVDQSIIEGEHIDIK